MTPASRLITPKLCPSTEMSSYENPSGDISGWGRPPGSPPSNWRNVGPPKGAWPKKEVHPANSLLGKLGITTRTPLYVQPALWTQRQLHSLLVVPRDGPLHLALEPADGKKTLHAGPVDAYHLQPVLEMQTQTKRHPQRPFQYLENIVWATVYSFTVLASEEHFIIHHLFVLISLSPTVFKAPRSLLTILGTVIPFGRIPTDTMAG